MLNLNCDFVNIWNIFALHQILVHKEGKIMEDEQEKSKEYYEETIITLLKKCNDIELLDLIIRLLRRKE